MDVAALIRTRVASGSVPGRRGDGARLALAVEGGGSRATYSSGMVIGLEEMGALPAFDAVYGSSAGALNAVWFVSGQAALGAETWSNPAIMRRVLNPLAPLHGRAIIDTEHLIEVVYRDVTALDSARVIGGPIELHPMATDARTGRPADLRRTVHDDASLRLALRASACMPVLAGRPVHVAGRAYVDGGMSENLPIRTALSQGATHVLALRTRRAGYTPEEPGRWESRFVERYLLRHGAGGSIGPWRWRARINTRAEREYEADPRVLQVWPPHDSHDINRIARDPQRLRHAVDLGRRALDATLAPR